MCLPSLVHSLPEVTFSEPARSIKLCAWMSAGIANEAQHNYQHRRLNTQPIPSLRPCSSQTETGGHPSHRSHPSTGHPSWTNYCLHTLNDDAEETVTPATPPVPVRACRPPLRITSPGTFLMLAKLVTNFSLSGESQIFGPEPWIWTGWEDGGARRSMMVSF